MAPSAKPSGCENEDKIRRILDEIEEGYFETDLQGNILCYNESMGRILGNPSRDILGTNFREYTSVETAEKMFQTYNRLFRTGKPIRIMNYEIIAKDGRQVFIELSSAMMRDGKNRPIGFWGMVRDITERVLAQDEKEHLVVQLQQALRLEAVGTLAGGIAHDFNNILTSIQGYVSIIKLHTEPPHPNYEKLVRIDDLIQNGADLTRQLLGFALGGKYETSVLNINAVLTSAVKRMPRPNRPIEIVETYQDGVWKIEADRRQVEQALQNLFMNAVHAMPDGGTLGVRTVNREIDEKPARKLDLPPGRFVEISVSDTGIGMDAQTAQRIFEPFFTTRKMGRGTGLGLASTYGIMKNHDGRVTVESRPGEGSVFRLYFPAAATDALPAPEAEPHFISGSETILMVDDEPTILEIGKEILQELGYGVLTADSGPSALSVFRDGHETIALVILDMRMPGMNGMETYRRLKTIKPDIPILLVSGYDLDTQPSKATLDAWDDFIQKPFHVPILSRKIRRLLDLVAGIK